MKDHLRPALMSLLVLTLLTGILYPLLVTGIAQVLFPRQANGSLVHRDGKAVGSSLVGQSFEDPRYFWGRLSATGPVPYTAFNAEKGTGSSGSNLGPLNPSLRGAAEARAKALRKADPANSAAIPADLVTASGSGMDPDISPAAAAWQIPRVAKARGLSDEALRRLVAAHTRGPQLGVLGESRVNVLGLNLALDVLERGER
jgi:K+-transporting ATPase ATPase C chain